MAFHEVLEITVVSGFSPKTSGAAFSIVGPQITGSLGMHRNSNSNQEYACLYALLSALRVLSFKDISILMLEAERKNDPIRIRVITCNKDAAQLIDSIQDEKARKVVRATSGIPYMDMINDILEAMGASIYADLTDTHDVAIKTVYGWSKRLNNIQIDSKNGEHKLPDQFATFDRRVLKQITSENALNAAPVEAA